MNTTWMIPARDGHLLTATVCQPADRQPVATVLFFPGIGVRGRRCAALAEWLTHAGVRTVSFDYRGIGDSILDPRRARETTLLTWATVDAPAVFEAVERRYGAPIVLGHSFGGQLLGFDDCFGRARAMVLVGSQLADWRLWDGWQRARLAAIWYALLPVASRLWRMLPRWLGLGISIPSGVARQWAQWGRTDGFFLAHVAGVRERFRSLALPVRAYSFSDDDIAPPRAAAALLAAFAPGHVDHRAIAPDDLGVPAIGHFGFFRRELAEPLWHEVRDFVLERAS